MPTPLSRREARRFEDRFAEDLGGRRIFLSGAGSEKADVRRRTAFTRGSAGEIQRAPTLAFRGEAKTTRYDSYTFKAVDWFDLSRAARDEVPVFAIWFVRSAEGLAVIPREFAYELDLMPADSTVLPVAKSMRMRPGAHNVLSAAYPSQLTPRHGPALLVVLPYTNFIETVQTHAHYATQRAVGHSDTP